MRNWKDINYRSLILMAALVSTLNVSAQISSSEIAPDSTIVNLKSAIEKVMSETNTHALGIALVTKNRPLWIAGLGKANIKRNIDANENTMFRIGSVSKMFVALSILKLQEEGKLNLEDEVRDWIPEIEFKNRWEETHPIRIVHLLEHTTGWDGYHNPQKVHNDPNPATLKEGLDFHPHSRISRWIPGTRFSYCNSGPPVAAYIVEKITGQQYEDYVAENFFKPLGMMNTTFLNDDVYQKLGAISYKLNLEPYDYRHVIQRPSGAINSSAKEMANFIGFLLNRGKLDSIPLIREESLLRMETTKTTGGAEAGLQLGYGLGNSTSLHGGFVYRGHTGSLRGASTELAYLPKYGIGHVLFINSNNRKAFNQISKLIRDFETKALPPDTLVTKPVYSGDLRFRNGYYVLINPRHEGGRFLYRLFHIYQFEATQNLLTKSWILPGKRTKFYPISDSQFRTGKLNKTSLVKIIDPLVGEVLHDGEMVFKPIPGFVVLGQSAIVISWFGLMTVGLLVWAFAGVGYLIGKFSGKTLKILTWPSITTLLFFLGTILLFNGGKYHLESVAKPGVLSLSILFISVLFALSAAWSLIVMVRSRKQKIGKLIFWPMALLSGLHILVVIYLSWFGAIPSVTWA